MAIKTYAKGQKVQLSKNFTSIEFDCHGRGCCSSTKIDSKLVNYLQQIRDYFGEAVSINSGYRCVKHNANVGGASRSNHMDGEAADIRIRGKTPIELARVAEKLGILGIGVYSWGIHIDTRTTKYFWYDGGASNVKTFQDVNHPVIIHPSEDEVISQPEEISPIFKSVSFGSSGAIVKKIQNMLYQLGYTLTNKPNQTGVDGIFGTLTQKSVIDFQIKHNLKNDGIVGAITMSELEKAVANITNVKITANLLNVRSGPGIENSIVGTVKKNTIYKLLESKDGWGKIETPSGWISLNYTTKI